MDKFKILLSSIFLEKKKKILASANRCHSPPSGHPVGFCPR